MLPLMVIHLNWETVVFSPYIGLDSTVNQWGLRPEVSRGSGGHMSYLTILTQAVDGQGGGYKRFPPDQRLLPLPTVEQGLEQTHVCQVGWG